MVEMVRSSVMDDPVVAELMRAKAWLRKDRSLKISRERDGKLIGLPDGWPEGTDPKRVLNDRADLEVERWRKQQAAKGASSHSTGGDAPTGDGVKALKLILGGRS